MRMWDRGKGINLVRRRKRNHLQVMHDSTFTALGQARSDWDGGLLPVLTHWAASFEARDRSGRRRAIDVAIALTGGTELATSDVKQPDAAYAEISEGYVRLTQSVADQFAYFQAALPRLHAMPPGQADQILDGMRSELFRHVGRDVPGQHNEYDDNSDVWSQFVDRQSVENLVGAAVRWAMAHEFAHLIPDDVEYRAAQATVHGLLRAASGWWGNAEQRDELVRDYIAVGYLLDSRFASEDLPVALSGIVLGTLVLGFDGWFLDGSEEADTHPSPWFRGDFLPVMWGEHFARLATERASTLRTAADLHGLYDVADLILYARWVSGLYRIERKGRRDIREDQEIYRNIVVNSVGVEAISLPPELKRLLDRVRLS